MRAVRQTGPETARQWVIELDDQTRARIPLSWAVPDDPSSLPKTDSPVSGLWADVTGLLKLARMVLSLKAIESTEVTSDEATTDDPTSAARDSSTASHGTSLLGEAVAQTATGIDDSIDNDDGQADVALGQARGER